MKFEVKDVMRLSFKWPHEVSKRESADGSKDRHAVIFQNLAGGHVVAPITSVPPAKGEEQYAVEVTPRLQRQLGLNPDRKSYIKMNYANLVTPPNPSVKHATNARSGETWKEGSIPQGLYDIMIERQAAALKAEQMRLLHIPKHDAAADLRKLKQQETDHQERKKSGSAEEIRYPPNDPRRRKDMQDRVIQRAAEQSAKRKEIKVEKASPSRKKDSYRH